MDRVFACCFFKQFYIDKFQKKNIGLYKKRAVLFSKQTLLKAGYPFNLFRIKIKKLSEVLLPRKASFFGVLRADDGNRTRDLRTTNATHYRLCYISLSAVNISAITVS